MVKLVAFFKRRDGITPEQFQHHWRTTHAELVVKQQGLRRYVQNHTLLSAYAKGEPAYDGVAEA
ncbi:MAG: EthD family reductase [Proteobacteria bacterium]|nr:EthD family reductase [Pseudomonadota bacterium]